MNKIILSLFCCMLLACNTAIEEEIPARDYAAFFAKAKRYCQSNHLNQDFFILLDYAAHSGTDRFKIYDFRKRKVVASFPVSHGCYNAPWGRTQTKSKAMLSNVEESHASSKGKYLITGRGYSQWGINVKYLLDGLEPSNNNARRRIIVLHSWEEVADKSIYPNGTPEGWGCPAISNNNMRSLDAMLKKRTDKTLLWAID